MKESLDKESRKNLINYRVDRSLETLEESDCLANNGHYSGAVNRLYYASYYIVSALLLQHEIYASSHAGVRSMFALHFIRPGKLALSLGKYFNEIFELRHSNDYDDFIFCDEETFSNFRPIAGNFVQTLIEYIRRNKTE